MSLHDDIEHDLRDAMKARDKARTSALRMAIAALKNRAVADGLGPQGRLSDEIVQSVLTTETKRRREAADAFANAGRDEQAAAEHAEAEIYAGYLPQQLSDEELTGLVDEVVEGLDDVSPAAMGQVMKAVMAKTAGRADGGRVSAIVRQRLAR